MKSGWFGERHRHYLAAKGIKTNVQHKQKYFFLKTEESKVMKDDSGIFGWQHKNDTIKTNHRLDGVSRKRRVWMDRIEKGIDEGRYSPKLAEDFLEDTFKPLEEQYVNGQITRDQFEQELNSKGEFKIKQYEKQASAFNWSKPQEESKEVKAW